MSRKIYEDKNGVVIFATTDQEPHTYRIAHPSNSLESPGLPDVPRGAVELVFQHGTLKEVGPNGVTHEMLAAILIDRLRVLQAGKFPCRENACAITRFEEGLHWLEARTREREARGVEGEHKA